MYALKNFNDAISIKTTPYSFGVVNDPSLYMIGQQIKQGAKLPMSQEQVNQLITWQRANPYIASQIMSRQPIQYTQRPVIIPPPPPAPRPAPKPYVPAYQRQYQANQMQAMAQKAKTVLKSGIRGLNDNEDFVYDPEGYNYFSVLPARPDISLPALTNIVQPEPEPPLTKPQGLLSNKWVIFGGLALLYFMFFKEPESNLSGVSVKKKSGNLGDTKEQKEKFRHYSEIRKLQDEIISLLKAKYKNLNENVKIDDDLPMSVFELRSSIYTNWENEMRGLLARLRREKKSTYTGPSDLPKDFDVLIENEARRKGISYKEALRVRKLQDKLLKLVEEVAPEYLEDTYKRLPMVNLSVDQLNNYIMDKYVTMIQLGIEHFQALKSKMKRKARPVSKYKADESGQYTLFSDCGCNG